QEPLALGLGAEAQQQRSALALGHPVGARRRTGGQQLFQQHVALQERALLTAVPLGPREPDPAAGPELPAELRVESAPGAHATHRGPLAERLAQERADLVAESLGLRRQATQLELKDAHSAD